MKKTRQENDLFYKLVSSHQKRISLFREIPLNNQGFVLINLSRPLRKDILSRLDNREIVNLFHYLDPDEVADLLQDIRSSWRKKKIITKLNKELREKVEFLLKFHPRTAAGMMSLDYIEVEKNISFDKLSGLIRKHEKKTGKFPSILVVEKGYLVGELPGHILALHKGKEKIAPFVQRIPHIKYNKSVEEVLRTFKRYPHDRVVVLDEDDSILGVIYSDDILRVIERKSSEELYGFAGVSREEDILDSPLMKVRNRYGWLIVNLGTAFLAASVVGMFQGIISRFVLLAVYMPVVAGMGGNAGTQTLAVVVRGLVLRKIDLKTAFKVIWNEVLAGAINGFINGVLVAAVAFLWNRNAFLGLIVGLAMVINLIIAGFFGAIVPLVMKRLGKDPASSATVFITTATDVFGFLSFLGLASVFLTR